MCKAILTFSIMSAFIWLYKQRLVNFQVHVICETEFRALCTTVRYLINFYHAFFPSIIYVHVYSQNLTRKTRKSSWLLLLNFVIVWLSVSRYKDLGLKAKCYIKLAPRNQDPFLCSKDSASIIISLEGIFILPGEMLLTTYPNQGDFYFLWWDRSESK